MRFLGDAKTCGFIGVFELFPLIGIPAKAGIHALHPYGFPLSRECLNKRGAK